MPKWVSVNERYPNYTPKEFHEMVYVVKFESTKFPVCSVYYGNKTFNNPFNEKITHWLDELDMPE